jgi:transcriptional regulator GlxA family with amidase domain
LASFNFLQEAPQKTKICEGVLFTLTGPIFTFAGVSAGIDLALRIVSHLFGNGVGMATAGHMEYPYPESDMRRGRSDP